jgi:hypothetical protein
MINNIPHWTPPDWIDKQQTPIRNTYFDHARTTSPDATPATPAIDPPFTEPPLTDRTPKAPARAAGDDGSRMPMSAARLSDSYSVGPWPRIPTH